MASLPSVSSFRSLDIDVPELKRYLSRGFKILDVGCGRGTITFDVAKYVYPGEVIGIDQSSDMVSEATEWTKEAKSGVAIQFKSGDVHVLDFPDNTFDLVYSHTVAHLFIDPARALEEQLRVTKPGGWVITSGVRDINPENCFPPCPGMDAAWKALGAYWDSVLKRYQSGGDAPAEFMRKENAKLPSPFWGYGNIRSGLKCPGWFIDAGLKNLDISVKADFIRRHNPKGPGPWWLNSLPTPQNEQSDEDINVFQKTFNIIYDELIRKNMIDWNAIEDARKDVVEWCNDPRAFSFITLVFVAGQA